MRSGVTGYITPAEWRWVILIGCVLITLAFTPFLWVVVVGLSGTPWDFMGMLHDYQDGAVYLSEIFQGSQGRLLTHFLHTPEPHRGTFLNVIYPVLGQVAHLTGLSNVIMFHIGRAAAALFMYMSLYQLGAAIWVKPRSRRIFFVIASLGSGMGWLFSALTENPGFLDLTMPETFPFYSTLVNIHYPLATGSLALFAAVMVIAFQPGAEETPTPYNGGGMLLLISTALALIYPIAQVLALAVMSVYFAIYAYQRRRFSERLWRWLLWFAVPSLPMMAYYLAVFIYNPIITELFRQENAIPPSAPWILVASFGLPLLIALPGLLRGVRRFEPYGDQFMLIWLITAVALIYLPSVLQQRFAIGLMIPVAYFATRAIEDVWFNLINRRWRFRVFNGLIPVMAASHVLLLLLPVGPITSADTRSNGGLLLEREYRAAFDWLRQRLEPGTVVLAAPNTSLWLPAETGVRVAYGHPDLTLENDAKVREATAWFAIADAGDSQGCLSLLRGENSQAGKYRIRYVVVGPQERRLGAAACTDLLDTAVNFGSVIIYTYPLDLSVVP